MKLKIFYMMIFFLGMFTLLTKSETGPYNSGKMKPDQLLMLPGQEGSQMLSVVLRTKNGGLIVIDGGWESDGENLCQVIKDNGGHVNAWLLTHPHSDHAGALYHILKNRKKDIQIDKIYYSFAAPEWYQQSAPEDPGIASELFSEFAKLPDSMLDGSIGKGSEINVDDIKITALNDRYEMKNDPVNNSDIVYQAVINGKKFLFLGDLGYEGGERLLKECGKDVLKSDTVQMAHHGQGGVGKEVYAAAAPDICLWPTPDWLWNNDSGEGPGSGPWKTLETRGWMEELGVRENYCTKDGWILIDL